MQTWLIKRISDNLFVTGDGFYFCTDQKKSKELGVELWQPTKKPHHALVYIRNKMKQPSFYKALLIAEKTTNEKISDSKSLFEVVRLLKRIGKRSN